jgi:hypothetical protein
VGFRDKMSQVAQQATDKAKDARANAQESRAVAQAAKAEMEAAQGKRLDRFDSITLYEHGLEWRADGQQHTCLFADSSVEVTVDTAGQIDKRVTATRLILTGPFAFGLRKKKDSRELYLLIQADSGASGLFEVNPDKGKKAREFAAKVNARARSQRPASGAAVASTPTEPDVADQLRKLGELRDSGVLTEDEFNAKKAQLLERL